jgi:PAS domain S-box-containing protein
MDNTGVVDRLFTHRNKTLAVFVAWSATIAGLAWWYHSDHTANLSEMARTYARACHEKDVIYRRWNASNGGVYVPASESSKPNPYLQIAERDVTTPSGRRLTLVNPAYMTRQVHELAANAGDISAHITSLKPLNPNNAPDKWEQEALLAFGKNEKEASVVLHQDGKYTIRLMRPLYVENSCLKCHEQQGYKTGDLRGGISVTVPVDSIWEVGTKQARSVFAFLGGIWMLGVVAIVLVAKAMGRRRLEREQATHALAKKQEFLNAVLDNIRDGIVACDANGILTLFNPATRQFHGLPEEPIPADEWPEHFDLYLHDGTTRMRKEDVPLYRALRGETVQDVEMVIAPKHGKRLRLLADGQQLLVDGRLAGAVAVMHDISEQTESEEKLRQAYDQLQTIYGGIIEGLLITDIETKRFVRVNSSLCQMLGYTEEELLALSIPKIHPPEDASNDLQRFQAAAQGRVSINQDRPVVRKNGSIFYADITGRRIVYDGRPCLLALFRDITDRKRTEQQMLEARLAAEAANRAKSEFLANMSHEIRTPITAILGFSDILLSNPSPEEAEESSQIIKHNGEHLLQIINDILDLSKIEAGKFDVEPDVCSPRRIVADVLSLMKVRADAKGLSLTVERVGPIPDFIRTDTIRLRQILVNLVGNAVKFTEVGGVKVVVRSDVASNGKSNLVFDIIDSGVGMSQKQIALLFQPFSQVDASATRRSGGTGLGLAISKRLANMLGGEITVASAPGKGSTFSLTMALAELNGVNPSGGADSLAPQAREASSTAIFECRILLAEDAPDNRRLIAHLLRKAGAEVAVAENGQVAVDLALKAQQAQNPFDAILMDMQMPVMDGYEATRALRNAGYAKPIIALTANAMMEDRRKCLNAGCNDYLVKPIDRALLLQVVARYVDERQNVSPS